MDRRSFLAIATATTAGLFLPSSGLVAMPRPLVSDVARACSFCHKPVADEFRILGATSGAPRICTECVQLCSEIVREPMAVSLARQRRRPPPRPSTDPDAWRQELARGGFTTSEIDALTDPPRKRVRNLHCSFCDRPQHEVRKLVAGPAVFVCDHCVRDAQTVLRWSSTVS